MYAIILYYEKIVPKKLYVIRFTLYVWLTHEFKTRSNTELFHGVYTENNYLKLREITLCYSVFKFACFTR